MNRVLVLLSVLLGLQLLSFSTQVQPTDGEQIDTVLDELHHAASKADGERYFSLFAPDAVFLGTDATERWTIEQFREYAKSYFDAGTGWTYFPRIGTRYISLSDDHTIAWFDEHLDNKKYGECRGTGVLRKLNNEWKIAQYSLTFPIPNALAKDVVRMIRGGAPQMTTVLLVRHADKEKSTSGRDPGLSPRGQIQAADLSHLLCAVPLDAIYTTQFKRTQQTVEPIAQCAGVAPTTVDAASTNEVVTKLITDHAGETVLVCGHSNTIPQIIQALGVDQPPAITEDDYGDLFLITMSGPANVRLMQLKFAK